MAFSNALNVRNAAWQHRCSRLAHNGVLPSSTIKRPAFKNNSLRAAMCGQRRTIARAELKPKRFRQTIH